MRHALLRITLAIGCLCGLLLSRKLWLSSRSYPLTPVYEKLPPIPPPFDYVPFVALLLLLVIIAINSRPLVPIVAFLVVGLFLCLSDQSRLQPWFYQYAIMLAAFAFYLRNNPDEHNQRVLLNTCRLIIAASYFWSGLQKIGVGFTDRIFPSLINPYLNFVLGKVHLLPRPLILAIPLIEVGIGIGLLTRRFRNLSVVLALMTHLLILALLIPLKRNSVVWPWNIAMAAFAFILFWRASDFSMRDVLLPRKLGFQAVVMILFLIMPLLSFVNLWDSYLSASLYSGNIEAAVIDVSESAKQRLPPAIQSHVQPSRTTSKLQISPTRWSLVELNVPSYPERRIFMNVAKTICAYGQEPSDVILTIYAKPNRWNGSRATRSYQCAEL
ncbi:MAG: hypothetical protein ND895_04620 [Pyrinomonadaceae bacterium]|nr:hypothetical protein [Pyrinomonadaceae bacterium]